MRPSMMTLVSRILKVFFGPFLAPEYPSKRRQVQHLTLARAHRQTNVRQPEKQAQLEEVQRGGFHVDVTRAKTRESKNARDDPENPRQSPRPVDASTARAPGASPPE